MGSIGSIAENPLGAPQNGPSTASGHRLKTAEALVRTGLAETGLAEEDLAGLPGSDPRKVRIARQVLKQTTVSLGSIADRLKMRSAANVSQILRRNLLTAPVPQSPPRFKSWRFAPTALRFQK
ncbi:MAG: hypothetical protein ABJF10_00625 [Chthoniobacter sp.]|uniref:hypothetical protein n=1 Tax=Chthoniobacter sp. TaxID=2510640 RepID=UPI0032A58E18